MKTVSTSQRFFVYLIDMIIIMVFVSIISNIVMLFIPNLDENYSNSYSNYMDAINSYTKGDCSLEVLTDSAKTFIKYTFYVSLISMSIYLVMCFLYFVIFAHYVKFQTVGRLLLKAKVVDEAGNIPTLKRLILREIVGTYLFYLFLGSLGLPIIISIIFIFILKKSIVDMVSNTKMITYQESQSNMNNYYQNNQYDNRNNNYNDNSYNDNNNNTYNNDNNNSYNNDNNDDTDDNDDEYKVF